MKLVFQDYWWPQLWKYVNEFIGSHDVCAQVRNPHHRPLRFFQPLPILSASWFLSSMDFITNLPLSNSFDSILMVVDRLKKMAHFIPCNKLIIGEKLTKLFLDHVFWYHGLPKYIIFDHGFQFASKFWKRLFELLGVKVNCYRLSTPK
jgi:hypothetical protein